MARFGGLSSEAFSPPSGLGSILRDHKVLPGVRSTRANMGFGMVRPPVAHSVSVSASPKDSFLLDVGTADDSDDLYEEDIWAMDDTAEDALESGFEKRRINAAVEIGLGISPKQRASPLVELGVNSPKIEKLIPVKRKENPYGAADVFGSPGSKASSFFTRNPEKTPIGGRTRIPRRLSASRMIPASGFGEKDPSQRHAEGQSAPVEVPKWSKIMAGHSGALESFNFEKKGPKDDDDDRLPPHELLAMENVRSQRTSFSVCEGLGRTLKGRDLSRVRNAVWSQMGFAD